MATRGAVLTLVLGAFLIVAAGCKTTPKEDPSLVEHTVGPFAPRIAVSTVQLNEGRYPNLYAPNSFAVWVTEGVATAKLEREQQTGAAISPSLATDAEFVTKNYYVVEVNLESMFPDASIAYDVVGLRNMSVYLTLPDGTRVQPLQRIFGTTARESTNGALRQFGRTNIVTFPRVDVLAGRPTIPDGAVGVRLMIEGFNSTFFFEWANGAPELPAPVDARSAGPMSFSTLYGKLREFAHLFK